MNILVIGCDQVGASLIRDLERIGHDISLIERDPEQLKRLDAFDDYRFGGTALVGDPTDPDVLRRGGVENCDAVAAVSEDDSVNLMAAQIAKSIFRRERSSAGCPTRTYRCCTTRPTSWRPSAPRCSPSRPCSGHWPSKHAVLRYSVLENEVML